LKSVRSVITLTTYFADIIKVYFNKKIMQEDLGDVREIVTFDMIAMSVLKGLVLKCPYFTDVPYFSQEIHRYLPVPFLTDLPCSNLGISKFMFQDLIIISMFCVT